MKDEMLCRCYNTVYMRIDGNMQSKSPQCIMNKMMRWVLP